MIDPTTLQEGQVGDKVIIKITDRPQDGTSPRGTIERVLGPAGQHEVELHAIMAEFGLPTDFPEAVMHEAAAIATDISAAEVARRRDFRG
ncbi:MAG: ribonuclease R, partial [Candidatus Thorarchaeota archaeon]|nr:ribonuclease R [Candidatus Thorarchaeota archaeon]